MTRKNTRSKRKPARRSESMTELNANAAGIDIGSGAHYVAVPEDRDEQPVRCFESFTNDLHRLANWLEACGIETVAMESTGVYWIPLYDILEERGFEVFLVNARHVKNVPGRKTDVLDCQWIQRLHSFGLLQGSFRPSTEIRALRSLMRHREALVRYAASHVQHLQKSLVLMNVQLGKVLTDVTGLTGMKIIRDIAAGVTDPEALARHRDHRCKTNEARIAESLRGHYRPEHVFALKQTLQIYDAYQETIRQCDGAIEEHLEHLASMSEPAEAPLPPARTRKRSTNEPAFDIRGPLHRLTHIDLSQVPGIGPYNALRLIAELGPDMTPWPSAKCFTSWLALSPGNKTTGGKVTSTRTKPYTPRPAHIFRSAAVSVSRTQTAFGAFYRRIAARSSAAEAITATARKIAALVYSLLKNGRPFVEPGVDCYEQRYRERVFRNLQRRAKALGYQVVRLPETPQAATPAPA